MASTFGSENQVSESADSDALSESITANSELEPSSYERYPYPDEDAHNMEKSAASEVNESDNRARKALEWLAVIVGALLVAFLIKTFLWKENSIFYFAFCSGILKPIFSRKKSTC